MRQGGVCSYPGAGSQLAAAVAFLRTHRGSVKYLTIDIGANDIDPVCRVRRYRPDLRR